MLSALLRLLLVPSALLALSVSQALGDHGIHARDSSSSRTPAPISFDPDENWDGIDGSWSSFTIRIGTPPQYVRTFVSWASYQTWAVIPAGCNTTANYQDCSDARGYIYTESKSSTYKNIGLYGLSIEANLGYVANAFFGYDTVGMGGPGEEGPTLQHTVVGGMAAPNFYLGIFGINPKPTNFSSFNEPSTSYMTLLKEQNYIPSVSFGYTAGAPYRFTGVLASLTLGGYDSSKFVDNDVTFTFASDNSRDIVVAIQSITTTSTGNSSANPTRLLPSPVYAYMDATIAEIWLPVEVCKAFESAFGLTYDSTTQLYLVNKNLHEQLQKRNPSITFTLGTDLNSGQTVSIELPYAAFDLTAKPPYHGLTGDSYYFPLRRAQNETQYTIGRTFFQEAYIKIDYETQTFNVMKCSWKQNATPQITAIPPSTVKDGTAYPGVSSTSGSSSGMSAGAIAGVVVGTLVLLAIAGAGLFFCFKQRYQLMRRSRHVKLGSDWGSTRNATVGTIPLVGARQDVVYPKAELAGSSPDIRMHPDGGRPHSSGGLSSRGANTPRTPHGFPSPTLASHGNGAPGSPTEGYGTHSTSSTSGWGTTFGPISPMTPNEEPIYEMAGDMPMVHQKDGKELTEKEAIAHREKIYNGVESPSTLQSPSRIETPRRVDPDNVVAASPVVNAGLRPSASPFGEHRAFSFEGERDDPWNIHGTEDDLYS